MKDYQPTRLGQKFGSHRSLKKTMVLSELEWKINPKDQLHIEETLMGNPTSHKRKFTPNYPTL